MCGRGALTLSGERCRRVAGGTRKGGNTKVRNTEKLKSKCPKRRRISTISKDLEGFLNLFSFIFHDCSGCICISLKSLKSLKFS